jgi:hypothetical protein
VWQLVGDEEDVCMSVLSEMWLFPDFLKCSFLEEWCIIKYSYIKFK